MEELKTTILMWKYCFKDLIQQQGLSAEYRGTSDIYIVMEYLDIIKKTAREEQLEFITKLRDEYKKQLDKFDMLLDELKEKQSNHDDAYVSLCVAAINQNKFDEALSLFKNIFKDSKIKNIILTLYSDNADNFQKILLFLDRIENKYGYFHLFPTLQFDVNFHQFYDNSFFATLAFLHHNTEYW